MRRRREAAQRALLLLVTLAVLGVSFELGARLLVSPVSRINFTGVPRSITEPSPDPAIPYRLRPDSTGTHHFGTDPRGYFDAGATLTYRINELGFRGEPTSLRKPEGVFRVLGLGDSFTFGAGVRLRDTFLFRLEELLAERGGDLAIEVLNLGVPAYNTVHEVALLRREGLRFDPDLVLIVFFLNDAGGAWTFQGFNRSEPRARQPWWRRGSRLLDWAAFAIERRRAVADLAELYRASFRPEAQGWIGSRRALREAKRLSEEEGFDLALAIFPILWELSDDYPFRDIHATVTAFAERQSIPVFDLLPAFDGHRGPELWVHPNNQHPNELAHAIAARALAAFVSGRLPGPGERGSGYRAGGGGAPGSPEPASGSR